MSDFIKSLEGKGGLIHHERGPVLRIGIVTDGARCALAIHSRQ